MTAYTMASGTARSSSSTLTCQMVGGCSARTAVGAFLAVAIMVAACLVCVWSRTEIIRHGYALSETATEIKKLSEERERLRVRTVQLSSPERIEALARERLGMQFPEPAQIRVMEIGGESGGMLAALDNGATP